MGYLGKLRIAHVGKIFSNVSIAATVTAIFCALSGTITVLASVFAIMIIVILLIGSFGLIYVIWPQSVEVMHNLGSASEVVPFIMKAFLPSVIIAVITSIFALICLRVSPTKSCKTKIVLGISILVVDLLLLVLAICKVIPIAR